MIQNDCNLDSEVYYLEQSDELTSLDTFSSSILPKDFYLKLKETQQQAQSVEQRCKLEQILKTHKLKSYSPFYQTMRQGWGGIGYLLFSKNVDAFTALVGCL